MAITVKTSPELEAQKMLIMKGRNYLVFSSVSVDVDVDVNLTGFVGWSLTTKLSTSGLE